MQAVKVVIVYNRKNCLSERNKKTDLIVFMTPSSGIIMFAYATKAENAIHDSVNNGNIHWKKLRFYFALDVRVFFFHVMSKKKIISFLRSCVKGVRITEKNGKSCRNLSCTSKI